MKVEGVNLQFRSKLISDKTTEKTIFVVQFEIPGVEKNASELSKLFNQPLNITLEKAQAEARF